MSEGLLTISVWVDVGDESEVGTVAGFEEDSHDGDQTDHLAEVRGIELADDDEEDAGHDADEVDPHLLCPEVVVCPLVDQVADEAASRASDDVEKTEHGGPATGLRLAEILEVLEVVRAEDGVDGEFAAERADVAGAEHDGLDRGCNFHGFFEGGLLDDFVLHFIDDLDLAGA